MYICVNTNFMCIFLLENIEKISDFNLTSHTILNKKFKDPNVNYKIIYEHKGS